MTDSSEKRQVSSNWLSDTHLLTLAKGLLEHALKTSAIRDCQCAHCMGFKEEAPQWLETLANRIGAGIPPDGAPSMPTGLAALIRQRYVRDNWSGLTYDEAMAVAAELEAHGNETPAVTANVGWVPWHPTEGWDKGTFEGGEEALFELATGWKWMPVYAEPASREASSHDSSCIYFYGKLCDCGAGTKSEGSEHG